MAPGTRRLAMNERLTFNTGRASQVAPRWSAPLAGTVPAQAAPDPASADAAEPRDWAYLFLLAFTAVVFFRPQDTIPALRVLHLAEVCAIGGLAALVFGRLSRGLSVSRTTPELIGVIGLGMIVLATAPFSVWFGGAVGVFRELYSKVLLIFLLMVNVLTSPRRLERLTWLLVIAGAYIGFRAVLDYGRGVNLIEYGRVRGSVGGIFKNPNDLALNMVALLPFALCSALRKGSAFRRLLSIGCAVCMLGAVVVSHSRSGTLGLVAALAVLGWYMLRQRPMLLLCTVLAAAPLATFTPASYWERLSSITDGSKDDTGSRAARERLLEESTQAFLENPLTGVGAGQFKNWNPQGRVEPWRESHDVLLQVGAELGIGGLAMFLFLVARGGLSVIQTRRFLALGPRPGKKATVPARRIGPSLTPVEREFFDAHSIAIAAAFTGWFVCALFASVAYNWTFYYLLALAATPRDILAARMPRRAAPIAPPEPRWEAARA
jgi:putative inorganic carbon (HCO3(-)) transporter